LLPLCALAGAPAYAQQWPVKPVRIVVPFPPGQAADIIARVIAERLSPVLGQQVVVDNRPGAGGMIGSEVAAKSPADGYTYLLAGNAAVSIAPSLLPNVPYDPVRDFAAVTNISAVPFVFCVNPALPVQNIQGLVELARRRPGEISFGSSGNGATNHLAQALFAWMAGIKLVHVPYKGAVPSLTDLISGQIVLVTETTAAVLPYLKAGRIRALGVSTINRVPFLPEVATVDEQGVKGYDIMAWGGLVAPSGTPAPVLDRMNGEIVRILNTPEMQKRFTELALIPIGDSREHFGAYIKSELVKWANAIKVTGAKVD
jgi:tripartite-type tricarboxylate transporter receptor subunit TctC